MKRYSKLLAGASWMAEYGDPDTDDWEFLQNYSPYHSKLFYFSSVCFKILFVRLSLTRYISFFQFKKIYLDIDPDAKYPPILVTTSTRDDRVHPAHARKFVKVRRRRRRNVTAKQKMVPGVFLPTFFFLQFILNHLNYISMYIFSETMGYRAREVDSTLL
jgi:prolyl oligopeptidase